MSVLSKTYISCQLIKLVLAHVHVSLYCGIQGSISYSVIPISDLTGDVFDSHIRTGLTHRNTIGLD